MKQLSILILAAVFTCQAAGAQDRNGYDAVSGATAEPAPVQAVQFSPSVMAMRESERLQRALGLNAKQTKQVYKTVYNQLKSDMPQQSGFGDGMGGPRGGMGGPGGGMGPGRGMPGGSGQEGMQPDQQKSPREGAPRGGDAARQKALAKKFRKLFTPEQYAAWERLCAERQSEHPARRQERPIE